MVCWRGKEVTPELRRRIKTYQDRTGFLKKRGSKPDYLLIILYRAGDVEQNPGPGNCSVCAKTLRRNITPKVCTQCGGTAHASCSGMTRAEAKRSNTYTCASCRGELRLRNPEEPVVRPEGSRCLECSRALRGGVAAVGCGLCGGGRAIDHVQD